jgi:hypothetical protein
MPQPSSTIVEALSGDEVCPLCLDRFSAADSCSCVVCRVSSCPSCAEVLNADGAARCFACRPPSQPPALAARSSEPLSLPRPIAMKQAARTYTPGVGAARLPALPFPLTTSPQGVRSLHVKPPGSVFVGLPAVSSQLATSLFGSPADPRVPAQLAPQAKLARRPLQKLVLLARAVGAASALIALWQRFLPKERRDELRARLTTFAHTLARRGESGLRRLKLQASELAHRLAQHAQPGLRAFNARLARSKPRVQVDPSRPFRS